MTPSMTVNQRMAVSQRIVSQQTSAIALLPWLGVALSCLVRLLRPGCWSTAISYHFARASKGGLAPRGAHHKPPLRSGRGVQKASHPHSIRKGTANQKLSVQQHKIGEPRTADLGDGGRPVTAGETADQWERPRPPSCFALLHASSTPTFPHLFAT